MTVVLIPFWVLVVGVYAGGDTFQNRFKANLVAQYQFTEGQTMPDATTVDDSVRFILCMWQQ